MLVVLFQKMLFKDNNDLWLGTDNVLFLFITGDYFEQRAIKAIMPSSSVSTFHPA